MAKIKNIKKIYSNGVMALTARKGARFAVKSTEFEVFDSITGNSITAIGMEDFYWYENGIAEDDDRFSFFETYEEAVEFANSREEEGEEVEEVEAQAVYVISNYGVNDGEPMTHKQVDQWRYNHRHSEVSDVRIINIKNGKVWRFDTKDTVSLRYGKVKWIAA